MDWTELDKEVERQRKALVKDRKTVARQKLRLTKIELKKKRKKKKKTGIYKALEKALAKKKTKVRVIKIRQLQNRINQKRASMLSKDKIALSTLMR